VTDTDLIRRFNNLRYAPDMALLAFRLLLGAMLLAFSAATLARPDVGGVQTLANNIPLLTAEVQAFIEFALGLWALARHDSLFAYTLPVAWFSMYTGFTIWLVLTVYRDAGLALLVFYPGVSLLIFLCVYMLKIIFRQDAYIRDLISEHPRAAEFFEQEKGARGLREND